MSLRYKLLFAALLLAFQSWAQNPLPVNRGSAAVIATDARLDAHLSLKIPVVHDTTSAALNGSPDSLGTIIYVRTLALVYIRDTIPTGGHKWSLMGSGGADSAVIGTQGVIVTPSGPSRIAKTDTFFVTTRSRLQKTLDSMVVVNNGRYISQSLGTNFLGIVVYASRPTGVGNGIIWATDSVGFFLTTNNGSTYTRMTDAPNQSFNLFFRGTGQPGDTSYVKGNGTNNIYIAAQRDSLDSHTILNTDSSRTHYVNAHDSLVMQTKYRSDSARVNLYAALAGRVSNNGAATGIKTGIFSARPSASNCQCFYASTTDSTIYYDNGSWIPLQKASSGGSPTVTAAQVGYGNASNALTSAPNLTYDSANRVMSIGDTLANHMTVIALQRGGNVLYNKTRWFIGPQGNPEFNIGNLVYGAPYGPSGLHQSGDTSLPMIWHFMGLINGRTGWQGVGAGHANSAGDQYNLFGKNMFGFNYLMSGRDIIGGTGYSNGEDWFDPSTSNIENATGNRLTLRFPSATEAQFTGSGLTDVKFGLPVIITIPSGNALTDPVAVVGANATGSTYAIFDVTHNVNPYAFRVLPNGNVGIGLTTPTAFLHLAAGKAPAGQAPFKFTSGTPTTTPEIGAMHFNTGLLMLDSSNSVRDTVATRSWARNNISGGGGGGSAALNSTLVGFGSGSNVLTGSARLLWDDTHRTLTIGDTGLADPSTIHFLRGGTGSFNKIQWVIGPQGQPEFNFGNLLYSAAAGHQSSDTGNNIIWGYVGMERQGFQGVGGGHANSAGDQYTLFGKNMFGHNVVHGTSGAAREIIGSTSYDNGADWFDPATSNIEQTSGNRLTLRVITAEADFTGTGISQVNFKLPTFISIPSGNSLTDPVAVIGANATGSTFAVFDVTHNVNPYALRIVPSGNIGVGVTTPTAFLHLAAGKATAGQAPLKWTSGTPTTTPEAGAMHYNSGLLMLDSSTSVRDTMATRSWARKNIAGGGGGLTLPLSDNVSLFQNNSDNTKQVKLDLSGITTGTTRTVTIPNTNLTVAGSDISQTFSGTQTFNVIKSTSWDISNGHFIAVTNINSSLATTYAAVLTDHIIKTDATAAAVTITLPVATSGNAFEVTGDPHGIEYIFTKLDNSANAVTVVVNNTGTDNINGSTSFTLTTQFQTVHVVCIAPNNWLKF